MKTRFDFLRLLAVDVVLKILMCLHDPADIIRASAVSKDWRNFVISNGLCKQLSLRVFPQLATISYLTETTYNSEPTSDDPPNNTLEREHKTYASLFWACTSFPLRSCLGCPASASSTDNYPEESIINTMTLSRKFQHRYWSSKGHHDPEVPETLIYYLGGTVCVITEIDITPFQALFQEGNPIYSSKFVRFRMGHPKSKKHMDLNFMKVQKCADDKFVWTYTSQTFQMVQESRLQKFTLPEPVLCLGGFLQIELLGRVQKKQSDGKYYICVAQVEARGRQLSPAFSVNISEQSSTLLFNDEEFQHTVKIFTQGPKTLHDTYMVPLHPSLQNFQIYVDRIQSIAP